MVSLRSPVLVWLGASAASITVALILALAFAAPTWAWFGIGVLVYYGARNAAQTFNISVDISDSDDDEPDEKHPDNVAEEPAADYFPPKHGRVVPLRRNQG